MAETKTETGKKFDGKNNYGIDVRDKKSKKYACEDRKRNLA